MSSDSVGYLIGAVGIVVALVAWLRPRGTRSLMHWTRLSTVPLVDEAVSAFPSLTVSFREKEIPRLSMWTGKIWNAGSTPIRGADLRAPSFHIPKAQILGAWLSRVSSIENRFTVSTSSSGQEASLGFDFLNPGEGVELTILHTGSPQAHPQLSGAIVGGELKWVTATEPAERGPSLMPVLPLGLAMIGAAFLGGILISLLELADTDPRAQELIHQAFSSSTTAWLVGVAFFAWLSISAIVVYVRRQRTREPLSMVQVTSSGEPVAYHEGG